MKTKRIRICFIMQPTEPACHWRDWAAGSRKITCKISKKPLLETRNNDSKLCGNKERGQRHEKRREGDSFKMAEEYDIEITFLPTNTSKIHLHMEQLLQNTCWTLAEDLRLPKRQETPPHTWVWQKKKQRQKNRNGTSTSGRELWRRKSFHTLGSSFTGGDGGWRGGGKLRSHGGEHSNRGAEGKVERYSRTEDRCWLALTSPRGLSAHPPGWVGAGSWGLGFRDQIPGRGLGLAAWTQPEGGYCATASREGVWEEVWNCLRGKRPLFRGARGEGIQSTA